MKLRAPEHVGGFYHSYASGNGALSFVHSDIHNKATGENVPLHIADAMKPEGYRLTDHNGSLEAYKPVQRVNDVLALDGNLYRYRVASEGNGWKRHAFYNAETEKPLINLSMKAQLEYFIANEPHLKKED